MAVDVTADLAERLLRCHPFRHVGGGTPNRMSASPERTVEWPTPGDCAIVLVPLLYVLGDPLGRELDQTGLRIADVCVEVFPE